MLEHLSTARCPAGRIEVRALLPSEKKTVTKVALSSYLGEGSCPHLTSLHSSWENTVRKIHFGKIQFGKIQFGRTHFGKNNFGNFFFRKIKI